MTKKEFVKVLFDANKISNNIEKKLLNAGIEISGELQHIAHLPAILFDKCFDVTEETYGNFLDNKEFEEFWDNNEIKEKLNA